MGANAAVGIAEFESTAFARLKPRLLALRERELPFLDPQAFAKGALLASDALSAPDVMKKLRSVAAVGLCDVTSVEEVGAAARALLFILRRIEAAPLRHARGKVLADEKLDEADALRRKLADVVEKHLVDDDDARLWLEIAREPAEVLDIVFDLRNLARAIARRESELASAELDTSELLANAERVANALENEVDPWDAGSEWADWLARAWTYLVPRYDEALRVARFVLHAPGAVVVPSLVAIARRARRTRASTRRLPRGSVPPPPRTLSAARLIVAPPPLPVIAAPPPLPFVPEVRVTEAARAEEDWNALATSLPPAAEPERAPEPEHVSAPPSAAAPSVPAPPARTSVRAAPRHDVELEVGLFSDSNFYVGFTENLSDGGVFVATYMLQPIGSKVEVTVGLPGLDEPMKLTGEVRWVREASSDDLWPGMGIRFDAVGEEDERRIRAFLAKREPLFFDE